MASHLANIFGTEQDRVNCSFYYKIGACRHGDRCSRKHIRPTYSQTMLLPNVYENPIHQPNNTLDKEALDAHFNQFYEDFFCDHLIGNVYARFEYELETQAAVEDLNQRWYAGKPLYAELSPVTDFREACCRQHEDNECNRSGFCNFMHVKHPPKSLIKELQIQQRLERRINPSGPIAAEQAARKQAKAILAAARDKEAASSRQDENGGSKREDNERKDEQDNKRRKTEEDR